MEAELVRWIRDDEKRSYVEKFHAESTFSVSSSFSLKCVIELAAETQMLSDGSDSESLVLVKDVGIIYGRCKRIKAESTSRDKK